MSVNVRTDSDYMYNHRLLCPVHKPVTHLHSAVRPHTEQILAERCYITTVTVDAHNHRFTWRHDRFDARHLPIIICNKKSILLIGTPAAES